MKQALNLAFRLALIVAVTAAMLVGVNAATSGIIAEREEAEGAAARASLISGTFRQLSSEELPADCPKTVTAVYAAENGGTLSGYCMYVSVNGFGGSISMVVGMDADLTVTGVRILSDSETPGIGSKAVAEDGTFLPQFRGLSTRNLTGISAVSGATISSKAVIGGVNDAVSVGAALRGKGARG